MLNRDLTSTRPEDSASHFNEHILCSGSLVNMNSPESGDPGWGGKMETQYAAFGAKLPAKATATDPGPQKRA